MTTASLWGVRPPSFWCLVALGLITVAGTPLIAAAQEVVPKAGDRVRVTVRVPSYNKNLRYVGNLGGWDEVALRWESAGSPQSAPLDRVTRLELSRGTKSNAGKGALIGLVSGAAGGVALAFAACKGWTENCWDTASTGDIALLTGAVGAAGGAAVGALIGLAARTDRWSAVPASVYGGMP